MNSSKNYQNLSQIFEQLNADDLHLLNSHTTLLKLKRGQPLFLAGDKSHALYAVVSGCLKNVREAQTGKSLITRIVGPGKLVGLRELFVDFVYHRTCIALEESEVLSINQNAIITLIKKNPDVGFHFVTLFSQTLARMEDMLEAHLNKSAKKRLATVIYDFYQMFANKGANSFVSPLQRRDIAELAGMTPETVSRSLKELKKEHILQTTGKHFTLLDPDALKHYDE